MKSIMRIALLIASLLLALASLSAEANQQSERPSQKKSRNIWLRIKTGPTLAGDLVKMDSESVDFTIKGILQTATCEDSIGAMVIPPSLQPVPEQSHSPPSKPVIHNRHAA